MRDDKIMIRVSEEEKQLIDKRARDRGLMTASWARMALLQAARAATDDHSPTSVADRASIGLLSLFCGPGGLDEGFRQAGFSTIAAIDKDQDCVRTFAHNHRDARAGVFDITKLTVHDLD